MSIALLTRKELEILNNRSLKYPLAVAEKDYMLAVVSKIIYDSPLKEKLVFKGETALHHCYLDQMRFSEDLDFTCLDKSITIDEVREIFAAYDFLEIKKEYTSPATIKFERLSYNGPLGQPNSLKVEMDFIQNVVLPAKDLDYNNVWRVDTKARAMDIREICAEKILATSDRSRYRDFYDLLMILKNFNLDMQEIIDLIKQKEIRKPISKESILANWQVAREDKIDESVSIYYTEEAPDAQIKDMIDGLPIDIIQ